MTQLLTGQNAPLVPNAPKPLQPPKGQAVILQLSGKGSQIYICQNSQDVYAWKLKAPEAKLFTDDGAAAGTHFAGPTWEGNDGSRVTGQMIASVPAPDPGSIPWLLLKATSHKGPGVLFDVQSIQRLNTKGGISPAGSCSRSNEKQEISVPYEARYYFYGSASH